eukprot:2179224-Rhodomonas_salina.2
MGERCETCVEMSAGCELWSCERVDRCILGKLEVVSRVSATSGVVDHEEACALAVCASVQRGVVGRDP